MKVLEHIVIILGILLASIGGFLQNESKAATYLIEEAELYSKGEMVCFRYQEVAVAVHFVVYQKDGVEYPAYCLDKKLMGVTAQQKMRATVNNTLQDENIWKVIINGYPFVTPAELKCRNEHEAFAATKMAVYDVIYNYDWSDFEADSEQGKRILIAAQEISKNAKNSEEKMTTGIVTIQPIENEWKNDNVENEYISKNYEVITNAESVEYTVQLKNTNVQGIKIVNNNNEEQSKFQNGERFKILLPMSNIENVTDKNITFEICVEANLRTKPILYGETGNSSFQDYALVAGEWEYAEGRFQEEYKINGEQEKESLNDEEKKEQEELNDAEKENQEEKEVKEKTNGQQNKNAEGKVTEEQKSIKSQGKKLIGNNKTLPRTGF